MTNIVSYDPFTDTGWDDLFRGFFAPVRRDEMRTPVMVKMDVTETATGYLIHAEMPGVKKEGEKLLRSERYYGNVYRSFTLPAELDESASEAKYANGVLELKLVRKAPVATGRKLPIM